MRETKKILTDTHFATERECKQNVNAKRDTTNNTDNWNHLNTIKKISVIDARKSRHQTAIEKGEHALRYVVYCFNDKIYFGLYYLLY
jgi:hypothetical protein